MQPLWQDLHQVSAPFKYLNCIAQRKFPVVMTDRECLTLDILLRVDALLQSARGAHPVYGKGHAHLTQNITRLRTFFPPDRVDSRHSMKGDSFV
jgi:hypothetical protein